MAAISPPKYVYNVLHALEAAGFEAFMVGGCVRDALRGVRPSDWDICTSALPQQVSVLFPKTYPTGIAHGTVTVISAAHPIEVTTFRADGDYLDHRRPESVEFVGSLAADLQRRDFTVNAMALSSRGELSDPFGGREDLQKKTIRCVGDPERRFGEDALRMLRALRFSAVLGFCIEDKTYSAIKKCAGQTRALAAERISAELSKTLCSKRPQLAGDMLELGLLCRVLEKTQRSVELSPLSRLPRAAELRWAGFCAALQREGIISEAEVFLRALRLDSSTIKNASSGAAAALSGAPETDADWKRLSSRIGDEGCFCAAAAAQVLGRSDAVSAWRRVSKSGDCRSIAGLDISGGELMALGLRGAEIGAALERLLGHVIEQPYDNKRDILIKKASELCGG